ncbi:glutathione S-transferase family protein [Consotaella salsifontis]|uniref:Glutathione S-transferase n=1 Tax=Consotaella salsifontis TaxID=1365950 RepID=A0A1T4T8X4_9HYPH|nr:glutathione S-transferase [Consotaella salsifontis]SKA36886.1 glutathione S-transferase [Consotaella salsifontis]
MTIELYYWLGLPGRGEYARLVLEAAGAPYREMAQLSSEEGGGMDAMMGWLDGRQGPFIPFAPPFLKDGEVVVSQAGLIAAYLGEKLGLAPQNEAERHFARSVALTTADFVAEVHNVHHPIATGLYYDDQKEEARRNAEQFRAERMPKFLGWYERLITANPAGAGFLVGGRMSYADLGLFQTVEGLNYAFPRRMETLGKTVPRVVSLCRRIAAEPMVKRYLESERRQPFNEDGIFRHYPELDGA